MSQKQVDTVQLPSTVVERVEKRLPSTEFDSTSEYIGYVLEEVLHQIEQETEGENFEAVDENEVKDRLESLGYLKE